MRGHARDTLIFIIIAVALMGVVDYFFMGGKEAYRTLQVAPPVLTQPIPTPIDQEEPLPQTEEGAMLVPGDDYDVFDFFNDEFLWEERESPAIAVAPEPEPKPIPEPMVMDRGHGPRPRIAIIIDDIGMSIPWSREAVNLPGVMTMAVLPYAAQADEFARLAKESGHDVLIHTPMEAMNAPVSLGGMGLTTDMSEAEIIAMMELIALRMKGYIGINNHMGSKFTANRAAMEKLMPYLKARGLIFVDSRTIGSSVAATIAAEQGVPHAVRDVFLDHEETTEFVADALALTERTARRNGYAIAIGHPKAVTINGLKAWIPTLEAKGFDLVGISALVKRPVVNAPVTASAAAPPAPAPSPAQPTTEQLLLYSPSQPIHF